MKTLITNVLFLFFLVNIQGQSIEQNNNSDKGFYIGVDAVLFNIDKWSFIKNDLNIEETKNSRNQQSISFRPLLGYHFNKYIRTEVSFWKKEVYQELVPNTGETAWRAAYDANLFTARLQVDKYVLSDILSIHPSLGFSYGFRGNTILSSSVFDLNSNSVYKDNNLSAIEFGLGTRAKIFKKFIISVNAFMNNGLSNVVTTTYTDLKLNDNGVSIIENKGSNFAVAMGLQYQF